MHDSDEILAFALTWRHWGGGPAEDIMLTFGLPPAEYFPRLQTHLDDGAAATLPPEIVRHLTTICDTRLTELDHNPEPSLRQPATQT